MSPDRKSTVVSDVRSAFAAEPGATREERVAWLRTELQKGLYSGTGNRSLQQIYDDVISRRDAG
jgi:hypothetical protein